MWFFHGSKFKGGDMPPLFIINRRMAYTFFPKTASEIQTTLKSPAQQDKVREIMDVFAWLNAKYPSVETPINIDPSKLTLINVTRQLEGDVDLSALKRYAKLSKVKLKFGSGSSGNRGVNNRGNLFEPQFAKSLLDWFAGVKITDTKILAAIKDLDETYNLKQYKDLQIIQEGELNKKRPLVYTPDIIISAPGGKAGNNIGAIVTDLTVMGDGEIVAYLSLKLGTTATFFNVGVKTVLTTKEIQSGVIENADGIEELRILFKNVDSLELYANLVYIKEVGNIATTINFADVVARDMLHDRYVLYSRYVNKKKKGIKF